MVRFPTSTYIIKATAACLLQFWTEYAVRKLFYFLQEVEQAQNTPQLAAKQFTKLLIQWLHTILETRSCETTNTKVNYGTKIFRGTTQMMLEQTRWTRHLHKAGGAWNVGQKHMARFGTLFGLSSLVLHISKRVYAILRECTSSTASRVNILKQSGSDANICWNAMWTIVCSISAGGRAHKRFSKMFAK